MASLKKMQSDDEDETQYVDSSRCIVNSLEMRAVGLALPDVPTHTPVIQPRRLTPEEEYRAAMEEKLQSDDDGDSDEEEEEEEKNEKKSKKRRRGPDVKKTTQAQVNQILDTIQNMHTTGRAEEDYISFIDSLPWTDKKIFEFKQGLMSLMAISNKSATATEATMIKYISGLQNNHPDAVLSEQCREMPYTQLQKATVQVEDEIFAVELELKRLKNNLKIHKFFLEVHAEKTQGRCDWMNWFFNRLTSLEHQRFLEVASKTSARKEFGKRTGGGKYRSNEV